MKARTTLQREIVTLRAELKKANDNVETERRTVAALCNTIERLREDVAAEKFKCREMQIATGTPSPLFTSVDELETSIRAANALVTLLGRDALVGDIVQRTESDLLRVKTLGRKTVKEIKNILSALDLSLGMTLYDWPAQKAAHLTAMRQDPLEPMFRPITTLGVSMRSYKAIWNMLGLDDTLIGDLVQYTGYELSLITRTSKTGRKTRKEIKTVLATLNLSLGMKTPDWPALKAAHLANVST